MAARRWPAIGARANHRTDANLLDENRPPHCTVARDTCWRTRGGRPATAITVVERKSSRPSERDRLSLFPLLCVFDRFFSSSCCPQQLMEKPDSAEALKTLTASLQRVHAPTARWGPCAELVAWLHEVCMHQVLRLHSCACVRRHDVRGWSCNAPVAPIVVRRA